MIYLVWLKIAPLPSCRGFPPSFAPEMEGAVWVENPEELDSTLRETLRRHRCELVEVEACRAYRSEEWDDARDPRGRLRALAQRAAERRAAVYGSFGFGPGVI